MNEQDGQACSRGMRPVPVGYVWRGRDLSGAQRSKTGWEDGEGGFEVGSVEEETVVAEICSSECIYCKNDLGRSAQ